jgi:hypothetical protein
LRDYLTAFRNRITVWEKYRKEVTQSFDNFCGAVPLFEKEMKGLRMIMRRIEALFSSS